MSGFTDAKDRYLAHFEHFSANGGAAAPDWVKQTRGQAIERFADLGFPTTRAEEWRFTNVKPIADEPYELTGVPRSIEANIADLSVVSTPVQRVVIADGHFSGERSSICQLPDGVTVGSLSSALDSGNELVRRHLAQYARFSENAFTALCTAFLHDGAFIHVPKNTVVETPIEVLFVSSDADPTVTHPRCLVLVDSFASVFCAPSRTMIRPTKTAREKSSIMPFRRSTLLQWGRACSITVWWSTCCFPLIT